MHIMAASGKTRQWSAALNRVHAIQISAITSKHCTYLSESAFKERATVRVAEEKFTDYLLYYK